MAAVNLKQIACYLPPDHIAALKKLSEHTGAPVAHYLRKAVEEFLERQARKTKP